MSGCLGFSAILYQRFMKGSRATLQISNSFTLTLLAGNSQHMKFQAHRITCSDLWFVGMSPSQVLYLWCHQICWNASDRQSGPVMFCVNVYFSRDADVYFRRLQQCATVWPVWSGTLIRNALMSQKSLKFTHVCARQSK